MLCERVRNGRASTTWLWICLVFGEISRWVTPFMFDVTHSLTPRRPLRFCRRSSRNRFYRIGSCWYVTWLVQFVFRNAPLIQQCKCDARCALPLGKLALHSLKQWRQPRWAWLKPLKVLDTKCVIDDSIFLCSYQAFLSDDHSVNSSFSLQLVSLMWTACLTDGRLLLIPKKWNHPALNVKDGVGDESCCQSGGFRLPWLRRKIRAITTENEELKLENIFFLVSQLKRKRLMTLWVRLGVNQIKSAYVVDDVIDLQVMPKKRWMWQCAHSDAHVLVQRHCSVRCLKAGGEGVAREVAG